MTLRPQEYNLTQDQRNLFRDLLLYKIGQLDAGDSDNNGITLSVVKILKKINDNPIRISDPSVFQIPEYCHPLSDEERNSDFVIPEESHIKNGLYHILKQYPNNVIISLHDVLRNKYVESNSDVIMKSEPIGKTVIGKTINYKIECSPKEYVKNMTWTLRTRRYQYMQREDVLTLMRHFNCHQTTALDIDYRDFERLVNKPQVDALIFSNWDLSTKALTPVLEYIESQVDICEYKFIIFNLEFPESIKNAVHHFGAIDMLMDMLSPSIDVIWGASQSHDNAIHLNIALVKE